METDAIKSNLIQVINKTTDTNLLFEISKLVEINSEDHTVISLSKEQKSNIQIAIDEVENGEVTSHSEHQKMMREWLND
ncbi:MAG: hypothetical protein RJQ09_00635 [Cyclobacteriaceae bacterium]